MPISKRKYGWKPDPYRHDDVWESTKWMRGLPDSKDLSQWTPPIWDQGDLGSCTAHGTLRALLTEAKRQGETPPMLSRLMLYYLGRLHEGTVNEDSGCAIADVVEAAVKYGACDEQLWPYDITKFTEAPPRQCYVDAIQHRGLSRRRIVQSEPAIKSALANGYAVVFGIRVYESFESDEVAKTGIIPLPRHSEKYLGGHCLALTGYRADQLVQADNSWNTDWGIAGRCLFPWEYLLNPKLASDFQILPRVV